MVSAQVDLEMPSLGFEADKAMMEIFNASGTLGDSGLYYSEFFPWVLHFLSKALEPRRPETAA
jgi:hypothetical protein